MTDIIAILAGGCLAAIGVVPVAVWYHRKTRRQIKLDDRLRSIYFESPDRSGDNGRH